MKLLTILLIILSSCKSFKTSDLKDSKKVFVNTNEDLKLQSWYQNDNNENNIPGISLNKWYESNHEKSKVKTIIVATLDTQIDTEHEDLKNAIWTNKKEIPNNNIDDDHNGYVDDINGWNFLGTKSGNYIVWGNYEFVRYIRAWKPLFENKTATQIDKSNLNNFNTYNWALAMLRYKKDYYEYMEKSRNYMISHFPKIIDTLKYYFPKQDYTNNQLDSLYNTIKISDRSYQDMMDTNAKDLPAMVYSLMCFMNINEKTLTDIQDKKIQNDSILYKSLNLDYNERIYMDDNPNLLEKGYGNPKINAKIKGIRSFNAHNTKVSGIIASNRENNIGTKGFSNQIKIMPLTISPSGDEHDKDIALAIRYAVDNGAKVINMSFGKNFSVHKEWVFEALQYAESKQVLVVHSAGNDSDNNDIIPNYPNDYGYDSKPEVCNNLINVGSTTKNLDSTFVSSFSNYGKKMVDLFAPGEDIYTAVPNNSYEYDSGTSLAAPMVSGTAVLIWLYYPKLTASEVKQIILDSGTAYELEVLIPGGEGKKTKFSELSKSGKVVNVYNAMKMAKEYNRRKKP
jgi:cell wall-associated protease